MSRSGSSTSATVEILAHHHQRHVADHLGGRRHLDDVAEHQVDVVIGLRHLVPARFQPQRTRLFLEVGELAARHLVQIDLRSRPLQVALEGGVLVAHRLPVERDAPDPVRRRGRCRARCPRSASTIEPRQGCEVLPESASIAASTASTPASTAASTVAADDARGVVGVEVDRQVGRLAQRLEQHAAGRRLQQPGHVLDGDDVGAGRLQLLGQRDVVFQVVFRPSGSRMSPV